VVLNLVLQRHPDERWMLAALLEVGDRARQVLLRRADALLPRCPRVETTFEDVAQHVLVCLRNMPVYDRAEHAA